MDWTGGTADASAAERAAGFLIARIPGSPDVLKEIAVADMVFKDAAGNVGIGTASPVTRLHVVGATTSLAQFTGPEYSQVRHSDGTRTLYTQVYDNLGVLGTESSTPIAFATANTERMRIDSLGRVGIGTSAPSTQLHLAGTGEIKMTNAANSSGFDIGLLGGGSDATGFIYQRANAPLAFGTNNDTRMTISGGGNVGIGTATPGAKLDVFGASSDQIRVRTAGTEFYRFGRNTSTGFMDFYGSQTGYTGYTFGGVDGERMRIDSSGNLLVGVPGHIFPTAGRTNIEVNGSSQALFGMGVGGTGAAYFLHDGTNMDVWQSRNGYMRFGTNGAERMRIDSSGNLLVGTTAAGGATTNTARVTGGIFSTFNATPSVPHNTATTVATLPSGDGVYLVTTAMVNSGSPSDYNETAIVSVSQSTVTVSTIVNATAMSITMSGLNVQLTQGQGTTQTCSVSILRLL